jgi:DNA-binding MarR family transcriptional regulator
MEIPVQAQIIKKMYDNSYDDLRKKYSLTRNEIMFLLYLDKHQMKNTAREIVEDLMTTKSHISKSVDSLAKENIIIRIPDEYDRKIIRLFINKTADYILNDLKQREKLITKTITKGISKDDMKTFEAVLNQMQKNCMELLNNEEI